MGTGLTGGALGEVIPDIEARKGWPGISSEQRRAQDAILKRVSNGAMLRAGMNTDKATNDAATLALWMMQLLPACQGAESFLAGRQVACLIATTKPTPEEANHDITISRAVAKQAARKTFCSL